MKNWKLQDEKYQGPLDTSNITANDTNKDVELQTTQDALCNWFRLNNKQKASDKNPRRLAPCVNEE